MASKVVDQRLSMNRIRYFGESVPVRTAILALITALAWFSAILLAAVLRFHNSSQLMAAGRYILPIYQVLPWLAGLQCWRKVRRAQTAELINANGASLCYSIILALLSVTYVVLVSGEIAAVLVCKIGA